MQSVLAAGLAYLQLHEESPNMLQTASNLYMVKDERWWMWRDSV
jgi:hypothetical protein